MQRVATAHRPGQQVGVNYLAACDSARGDASPAFHQIAEGVRSVLLNVTAAAPTNTSWLTVYPNSVPNASNLNFVATQTIPNLVLAQVNAQGKVKIYNNLGTVDVLADVVAWFN